MLRNPDEGNRNSHYETRRDDKPERYVFRFIFSDLDTTDPRYQQTINNFVEGMQALQIKTTQQLAHQS